MDTGLASLRAAVSDNKVNDDTFVHTCRAAKKRCRASNRQLQISFFVLLDEMEKQYLNDSSKIEVFGTEIINKELITIIQDRKIQVFSPTYYQKKKVKWRRVLVF